MSSKRFQDGRQGFKNDDEFLRAEDLKDRYGSFCRVVGNNIKRLLRERNMTSQQLCTLLHRSRNYIYMITSGRRSVSLAMLVAIADILQVEPSDLLVVHHPGDPVSPAMLGRALTEVMEGHAREWVSEALEKAERS